MKYPSKEEVKSKLLHIEDLISKLQVEMMNLQKEKEALQALNRMNTVQDESYG